VKVKEFLTELGVDFISINVVEDPQGMVELQRLGLRSVPAVTRGDRYVLAQSLPEVARFVGKWVDPLPRLSAPVLTDRWLRILDAAGGYVAMIPPERLHENVVPGRERTLRDVAYHIFQVPDAFLQTVEHGLEDWRLVSNIEPPDDVLTVAQVQHYADAKTDDLRRWWRGLADTSCATTVKMYYGEHSIHSFLERSTWHSAQHARQLAHVMAGFGIVPVQPLVSDDYVDLPMPSGLWT
jgi:hypothetical protein